MRLAICGALMTKNVVLVTKICGLVFAGFAAAGAAFTTELVHLRPPPSARTTQLMLYGVVLLLAVSVRLIVYGATIGKRIRAALFLALLFSVLIGVMPALGTVWTRGVSSDLYAGLFFMFIVFVVPCVGLSVVLSAVPIFDAKIADRLKPKA
jgi:hypothetical protein